MADFALLKNLFSPSVLASGATTVGNAISTGLTNAANERLAERANLWSIQQWQRENAYNDPRAQMSRLRAAGINPALAYTEGGIMNEAAPSPGVTSAAGTQRPYIMDPLTAAQVANINADTENKEFDNYKKLKELPYAIRKMQVDIDKVNSDMEVNQQKIATMSAEEKLATERSVTEQFNRLMADKEYQRRCEETAQMIRESASRILVNEADAALKKSMESLNWQQYNYLMKANEYTLLGLEWDLDIKQSLHQLNLDQHELNRLNEQLLGLKIEDGRVVSTVNRTINSALSDDKALNDIPALALGTLSWLGSRIHIGN